jgi:hypothetical protein
MDFESVFLSQSVVDRGDITDDDCLETLRKQYAFVRLAKEAKHEPELDFLAPAFLVAAHKGYRALAKATLEEHSADLSGPSLRTRAIVAAIGRGYGRILSPFSGRPEEVRSSLGREWYYHTLGGDFCLASQIGSISVMVDLETVWVFPQRRLILSIANGLTDADILLETAKTLRRCVNNAPALAAYLARQPDGRALALTDVWCPHMSHNLWNVQTGLANVLAECDVARIANFLLFENQDFFGDIVELYPDRVPDHSKLVRIRSNDAIFMETLDRNLLTFTVKDEFFTLDFVQRVLDRAHRVCDPAFIEEVRRLKQRANPLVVTTIRLENRAWIEQREGMSALFRRLRQDFPRLGLIMDGLSTDTEKGWSTYWMSMDAELDMANAIREQLPHDMPVEFGVGRKFAESLVLMGAADLFIAPSGSGMALYKWLFNMPGLAFSNRTVLDEKNPNRWPLRVWHDKRYRDDLVPTVHLSHERVVDGEITHKLASRANFHLDWQEVYQAALPLLHAACGSRRQ